MASIRSAASSTDSIGKVYRGQLVHAADNNLVVFMMHSAKERTHSDPAKVLNGTANPRIFGTGEMRACVAVLDGIRCGLNSSP